MDLLPKYLYPLYKAIKNLPIIQQKIVNDATLKELEDHLNKSIPQTEFDTKVKNAFVIMFKEKMLDTRQTEKSNHAEVFLYAPVSILCAHFGLANDVFIQYDRETNTFKCSLNYKKTKQIKTKIDVPRNITLTTNIKSSPTELKNSFGVFAQELNVNQEYTENLKAMLKLSPESGRSSAVSKSWADMEDDEDQETTQHPLENSTEISTPIPLPNSN